MSSKTKLSRQALAAALMSLVLAATLAACGDPAGPGSTTPSSKVATSVPASGPAPSTTSTATTSPSTSLSLLPIYWIAESRRSFALYREFRQVQDVGGAISSSVSAITRLRPLDPDYMTPWRSASRVTASQMGGDITVDLSADAFANTQVGSELADRAVQQLIYTATAAAQQAGTPAGSVRITVDGAAYDAWGVVHLGAPMARAPMAAVQAHTWVTSPQEGAILPAGTVAFRGFGTSFEANFRWEILSPSKTVVAKGFTTGRGGLGFGEFTFTAPLTAGRYSVKVSDDDPSGGAEGPGAAVDDKSFIVR